VVAAVGFKGRRLEIPSSIDPKVAALIDSCWVRYLVTYLLLFIFSELNDQSCFDESCYLYPQRTLETALVCQYHGIPETAHQNTTTQWTPRGKLVAVPETQASDILGSKRWLAILFIKHRGSSSCYNSYVCVLKFIQIIDHTDCRTGHILQERWFLWQYV
jgi:hypothetical protein